MDKLNILRKFKLHRLGYPIDSDSLSIILPIEKKFLDLNKVYLPDYPKSIFFFDNKENYIMEYYKNVLSVLNVNGFNISNTLLEIKAIDEKIFRDIINIHYHIDPIVMCYDHKDRIKSIELAYISNKLKLI